MIIFEVTDSKQKSEICNLILRSLPKWFGIESAIFDYVNDVKKMDTWAVEVEDKSVGFISINKHNSQTAEIHVMAILESHHRHGIGQLMIQTAEAELHKEGFKYLTVKTLSENRPDENYDKTRQFYLKMGFTPIEEFKTLWGEHNPCLMLIKNINPSGSTITNRTKESTQFPTLQTKRLLLRAFTLSDAKEVQRMAGSPKIAETTATIPHPYLDGMAEDWISKHQEWFEKGISVDFAIETHSDKKLVGNISLMINKSNHKAEIGYWIGEDYWNQGYCTEAMKEVIKYAFESKGLNKITCRHMMTNPASGKVMIKSGLQREGYLKQELFKNNKFYDTVVYGLLKEDWKN